MVRRQNGSAGNNNSDQAWITAHEAELESVLESDGNYRMRWSGKLLDEGSPYQMPPAAGRCRSKAFMRDIDGEYVRDADGHPLKRPCMNWPIKGGPVCVHHGGGLPGVQARAKERLVASADWAIGKLLDVIQEEGVDPRAKIAGINSVLDRAGIRAGSDISITGSAKWEQLLEKWTGSTGDSGDSLEIAEEES